MIYATYSQRIGASLIDVFCLICTYRLAKVFVHTPFDFVAIEYLTSAFCWLFMNVFMVKRFGGSPGKLLLGIRIVRADGARAGYREAMLRLAVSAFLIGMLVYAKGGAILQLSQTEWETYMVGLGSFQRNQRVVELTPNWWLPVSWIYQAWEASDAAVWLLDRSKKRRALHDYIAGTVVIRKEASAPAN